MNSKRKDTRGISLAEALESVKAAALAYNHEGHCTLTNKTPKQWLAIVVKVSQTYNFDEVQEHGFAYHYIQLITYLETKGLAKKFPDTIKEDIASSKWVQIYRRQLAETHAIIGCPIPVREWAAQWGLANTHTILKHELPANSEIATKHDHKAILKNAYIEVTKLRIEAGIAEHKKRGLLP